LISPSSPRTKTISVVLYVAVQAQSNGGDIDAVPVEVKDRSYSASLVTKQVKNLVLEATGLN